MCHPLYPVARRLVGRPVNVHHVSGRTYFGTLQSVTPSGLYLLHGVRGINFDADSDEGLRLEYAMAQPCRFGEATHVYSPLGYFGFGALTGLTLGALATGGYYW